MGRFSLTVLPQVREQLRVWKREAEAIPDPVLRDHALTTLHGESLSAIGAALVSTTVARCDADLVRLLVALQVAWDYVDTVAEQPSPDPVANGVQLHRALVDAVAPGPVRGDYYARNPQSDDGGYLAALVAACRTAQERLPGWRHVASAALEEVEHAEAQHRNTAPAAERASRLQAWASAHPAADASWIELAAAASSPLGVLALLTLAADPATTPQRVAATRVAYVPWVDALTALLDSHVDRREDAASGTLNWVSHYPSGAAASARLAEITARAVGGVRELPHGERHVVIIVGMIALYLSSASARLPEARGGTQAVLRAADSPAMGAMLVLLRAWRGARGRRKRWRARTRLQSWTAAGFAPSPTGQLTPVPPRPQ